MAETIERATFRRFLYSPDRQSFLLDDVPSTCGFAAGFEEQKTRYRAVCEAVERWAWSQWIDRQLFLPMVVKPRISSLGAKLLEDFDDLIHFSRLVKLERRDGSRQDFLIGIVLGIYQGGIFPGSRVCHPTDEPWEHAAIEAWRHRQIFQKK